MDSSSATEAELKTRIHQQEVVADIGQQALEADELDELMQDVTKIVAETLNTDYCHILELQPDESEFFLRQGVGWQAETVGNATVPTERDSQAGYTLLSKEPVIVDDLRAEERFSGNELLVDHDIVSGITVLIGSVKDPWGVLGTFTTDHRSFTERDATFVRSVANVLASAIERTERERRLEESNQRLEQFAYAASHDLREPLRMVSSYLSLIEDRYGDALGEDGQEFLEFAVDGAERMREMIDGLLQYSRVDTRGDPFEPVDLDDVLADVRSDLRVKIDESDAELTVDDLPRVQGDRAQLRQVFQNLLDNALEYADDEPPRVHVSAKQDGDEWIVSVSDEGIGIDPDHADRVFEVFQRLHTQEEHGGTGIGLALVERIVERHGGEIWVDSEPGEGTTFSFTLPVASSHNT